MNNRSLNPINDQTDFLKKKHRIEILIKRKLKQYEKAEATYQQELNNALNWEQVQHEAMLIQANLYRISKSSTQISVNDWKQNNAEIIIALDSNLSPAEEIARRFKKSKKLKRAIEPLQKQLEKTQKNKEKQMVLLGEIQSISSEEEFKVFCQKNNLFLQAVPTTSSKPIPILPYRRFYTHTGLQIWVGKSAKDNDLLTFTHAHGSDYWLHARDVPGSHVVLRINKNQEPDEESLKDAIQIALFYSKAKNSQEGEVCITQCKNVSRFGRHQPGKVQISRFKTVYARIDPDRLRLIRERKAGEEGV